MGNRSANRERQGAGAVLRSSLRAASQSTKLPVHLAAGNVDRERLFCCESFLTATGSVHGSYGRREMTIYFYTRTDEYGEFCNFSPHGFAIDGTYWPTVEHYFQAQKFAGTDHETAIRRARTPGDAKGLGRTTAIPLRSDWEEVKDEVMYKAVLRKFQTHKEIRERLFATGSQDIVENSPGDYYWGCGADGSGQNKLGRILMQVRSELQAGTSGSAT